MLPLPARRVDTVVYNLPLSTLPLLQLFCNLTSHSGPHEPIFPRTVLTQCKFSFNLFEAVFCVDSFGDVTWGSSVVSAFTCISTKYQYSPFTPSTSWLVMVSVLGPGPCFGLINSSLTYCRLLDIL